MHPDLRGAIEDIAATTGALSDAQLAWHRPRKWSTAETLEHLMKSFRGTAYVMQRALDQDRPKARPDTWKERLSALVVIVVGYFPSDRVAPEATRPTGLPAAEARDQVQRALVDLDDVATRCAARFGERTKVSNHPYLGALSVRQWRRFHRIHTRHHMKLIEGMKSEM